MIRKMTTRWAIAVFSCLAATCPQPAAAASPRSAELDVPISSRLEHVALHPEGILQGAVVDVNGTPLQGKDVWIAQQGETLVALKTNAEGRFAVKGLRNGVYQVVSIGKAANYQLWSEGAPDSARQGIIHVVAPEKVRANLGHPPKGPLTLYDKLEIFGTMAIIGGIIVAVAADDDNS